MNPYNDTASSLPYDEQITKASGMLRQAERIIVGIGSGLSAAGGLNYADPELAKRWYPEYYARGLETILDIQGEFWRPVLSAPERYWGFWAQHIWHIRYEAAVLAPYRDLYELIAGRDYFICTTNADGQVEKTGFTADRIFAPQGNYCYLQCSVPCTNEVYYNEQIINAMVDNMVSPFEIRSEDIPFCPQCGKVMALNLRMDSRFVETPHLARQKYYEEFVRSSADKTVVFLELGVGYNTPGIIRYPFERMTEAMPKAVLIRINRDQAMISLGLSDKGISVKGDLAKSLRDLKALMAFG